MEFKTIDDRNNFMDETNYWGKGVASYAIAKEEFDLNKLHAGIASGNIGSGKALEKN